MNTQIEIIIRFYLIHFLVRIYIFHINITSVLLLWEKTNHDTFL